MTKKINFIAFALSIFSIFTINAQSIERFAVYIGSNRGGQGRVTLRYAGSDAEKIANTMIEIGGVKKENSHILIDPKASEIDSVIQDVAEKVKGVKNSTRRVEFIFYYSGHSDENSLLLGNERYNYSALKQTLATVPSEVQVVMLDSCFSGNFIRAKGGQRQKAFLNDDSTVVQGHAYLSSSSESESSQESDKIGASFFTNSLVTGLRGAADTTGDHKVSLNELYYYSFYDTLKQTEDSNAGPQHPSFNITLVGSGDLILTDISEAQASLILASQNSGRFLIRNDNETLVSEVTKIPGAITTLALPSGSYTVTAITRETTLQKKVLLQNNLPVVLDQSTMVSVNRTATTSRGNATDKNISDEKDVTQNEKIEESEAETIDPHKTLLHATVVPSVHVPNRKDLDSNLSIIVVSGEDRNVNGIQAALLLGNITGNLNGAQGSFLGSTLLGNGNGIQFGGVFAKAASIRGAQGAGVFAMANEITGLQAAGVFTKTEILHGAQFAGFTNLTDQSFGNQVSVFNYAKEINGSQFGVVNFAKEAKKSFMLGLVNISNDFDGVPLGLLNIMPNNILEHGVFVDMNGNIFYQFQGGAKTLFTTLFYGTKLNFTWVDHVVGMGFGTRCTTPWKVLSFDVEALAFNSFNSNEKNKKDFEYCVPELRLTANFKILKHLTLFASAAADIKVNNWNDRAFEERIVGPMLQTDYWSAYGNLQFGIKF